MGRESGTKSTDKPQRFVIVGGPKTSKGKLTRSLGRSHGLTVCSGMTLPKDTAVGTLADYRAELKLAIDRCYEIVWPKAPTIFEHTLIDSVAYSAVRYVSMRDLQNVDDYTQEKWGATAAITGAMLRDSFKYDHVFVIAGNYKPDSMEFEIENALLAVVEAFGIPYSHLEGKYDENLAAVSQTIEAYLGSSTSNQ